MISRVLLLLYLLLLCNPFTFAQEKEKPVNIPSFIIHNKFTNKDSYTLIRWVSWTDDQKVKIFNYAQEQNKSYEKIQMDVAQQIQKIRDALPSEEEKNAFNEKKKTAELMGNAQGEMAVKVKVYIESLLTEDQKKEFTDKKKNASLMKEELEKNLSEFDEKTKQLKASPFNEHLYHVLTSATKYIHTPEVSWRLRKSARRNPAFQSPCARVPLSGLASASMCCIPCRLQNPLASYRVAAQAAFRHDKSRRPS